MNIDEQISNKLEELKKCKAMIDKLNPAIFLEPGKEIEFTPQSQLFMFGYWITKQDIALNEFHSLLNKKWPGRKLFDEKLLEDEKKILDAKLKRDNKLINKNK